MFEFTIGGQRGVSTDANGLYYMRQRYYNPEIKRFVNRDVLVGDISNSQSLNRYCYVQGNPISYVDPFGLSLITNYDCSNFDQVMLTLGSCIPGIGLACDIAQAVMYAKEGDVWNMAKSLFLAGVSIFSGLSEFIKAGKAVSKAYAASKIIKSTFC